MAVDSKLWATHSVLSGIRLQKLKILTPGSLLLLAAYCHLPTAY